MRSRISRLELKRLVAYTIVNDRDWLNFEGNEPIFLWPVERGWIPKRLWKSEKWRDKHITQPTLRRRRKWSKPMRETPGMLPDYEKRF